MSAVFIVQGVSVYTPGRVLKVFATMRGADAEAADLVRILQEEAEQPTNATPGGWREALEALRVHHGCNITGEAAPDVWVARTEVED